jgi:hypothetical protein
MNRALKKIIIGVFAVVIATGVDYYRKNNGHSEANQPTHSVQQQHHNNSSAPTKAASPAIQNSNSTLNKIRQAADSQKSGWWLTTQGKVIKLLKDDTKGHQHQKFLIKLSPDITLLVAHNMDLAPRVPLKKGDTIKIRGRYEWNNRGGVIHWTHHDPKGRKKDGWIYHKNKYYK